MKKQKERKNEERVAFCSGGVSNELPSLVMRPLADESNIAEQLRMVMQY